MMLLFYRSWLINFFGNENAVKIVFITLAGWNFVIEFLINVLISPVIKVVKDLYAKLFGENKRLEDE